MAEGSQTAGASERRADAGLAAAVAAETSNRVVVAVSTVAVADSMVAVADSMVAVAVDSMVVVDMVVEAIAKT